MLLAKNTSFIVMPWLVWQASCIFQGMDAASTNLSTQLKSLPRLRPTLDVRQKIIEWQCYAKCSPSKEYIGFEACRSQCKVQIITSPRRGQCPHSYLTAPTPVGAAFLKLSCLDECKVDFDCPEVQKCCGSACGPICLQPVGITEDEMLPPIPKILHLRIPRGHKVEITIQTSANTTIYYHVETRYHIGVHFSPRKFGVWQWQPVEMTAEEILENKKKRIQISFNLKPGRWYQVRIAAINEHGFRGYSEPSKSFTLSKQPRPPVAPTDLQVIDGNFNGKYYTISIAWCPSRSNLPVEKYKIVWSLYVKSKEESIISNEAFVREAHQFKITKLLPESSYYIQVLAMSISGSRRLKSDKVSILFNSTMNAFRRRTHRCQKTADNERSHSSVKNRSSDYEQTAERFDPPSRTNATLLYDVRFRVNQKFGMIVQINGFEPAKEKIYELCSVEANCEHKKYSAIRAKKHSLEFSKLKYNTTYFLKEVGPDVRSDLFLKQYKNAKPHKSFLFRTPKCEDLRKRFSNVKIKC